MHPALRNWLNLRKLKKMIPFVWEGMEVRLTPGFLKSLTLSPPSLLRTVALGPGLCSLEVRSMQCLVQAQASEV